MPPILLTYVIAKDVRGKTVSYEEFVARLQKFPRSAVIRLCSVLNMLTLAKWDATFDFESHAKMVRSFFPPRVADRMITSGRLVFHRHQLLYVAQEAVRHCTEVGRDTKARYAAGFGNVLLLASELLYKDLPKATTESEYWARRISQLLPDMEANGIMTSYSQKMWRSFLLTSKFLEAQRGKSNFFDIPALFKEATGIPLDMYQALLFGSLSRFGQLDDIKKSNELAAFAVPDSWFRSTKVPQEQIQRFFEYVSATAPAFADLVKQKNPLPNDFTVFRNKPLFADVGYFFPFDFPLLAEKFDSGPFWRVHEHIAAEQRANFHSFWGTLFEEYISWVFASSVDGKRNRFHPNPRYAGRPNEQVCDGVVICGRNLALIEYKSSTFTVEARYGGDPTKLEAELKKKLVGTPESRKGVYQLADAVEKLCRQDNPDRIEGVDMSQITTIFPLIITRDDLGAALGTNAFLNLHFQELMKSTKFSRSVTPLTCLSADALEMLSAYLPDTSLADALSARFKRDKKVQSSFWLVDNSVLAEKGDRKPPLFSAPSKKLFEVMAARLGLPDDTKPQKTS